LRTVTLPLFSTLELLSILAQADTISFQPNQGHFCHAIVREAFANLIKFFVFRLAIHCPVLTKCPHFPYFFMRLAKKREIAFNPTPLSTKTCSAEGCFLWQAHRYRDERYGPYHHLPSTPQNFSTYLSFSFEFEVLKQCWCSQPSHLTLVSPHVFRPRKNT